MKRGRMTSFLVLGVVEYRYIDHLKHLRSIQWKSPQYADKRAVYYYIYYYSRPFALTRRFRYWKWPSMIMKAYHTSYAEP